MDVGSKKTNRFRTSRRSAQRGVGRVFDAFGARPFGILVFAASVALLVYLKVGLAGGFRAEAIALARQVDHPARVASFVTSVYVRPGDPVEAGAPLVELSPHFIDQELARVDAEVEKLLQEAQLAQARLLVEEQRWLTPSMRLRPDRPSLERPTEALYAKELALLQTRRNQLLDDRGALTIQASLAGRVVGVAAPGSSIAAGGSVASVSPEFAQEIVAYVSPDTQPESISVGAPVFIARPALACRGDAQVLRRGAAVEEAPGQLRSFFRFPVHGMPVYISIPSDCRLGAGQVLSVEFARAVM